MKMIFWDQQPKDKLVIDLIAPDKKRKLTLDEAMKIFNSKEASLPVHQKYFLRQYLKFLGKTIKPSADLCAIDVGTILKMTPKFTGDDNKKRKFKSALPSILRLALDVESNRRGPYNKSNGQHPVGLTIKTADISTLGELLLSSSGKHAELKTKILDSIVDCPPGEYRVIEATKEIIEDEKERTSIRMAIQKTIQPKGWVIRWSPARNVFFVVRQSDLDHSKKVVKA